MNTERIKEIQQETGYPDSVAVQQALLKVWNETEQSLKAGQHETIVMLRNSLKDEIKRVADIVDETKSEDRDNIYYRGIEVGLNKALSLLEMHKAT